MSPSDEPEPGRRFGDAVLSQLRERRAHQRPALSPHQREARAERQAQREAEQHEGEQHEADER